MTVPTRSLYRACRAAAVLTACAALTLIGAGPTSAQPTEYPPSSGPIVFDTASGDQQTFFTGTVSTTGGGNPCTVAGADSYNSVISGPGVFRPGATEGSPDGRLYSETRDGVTSITGPIQIVNRINFVDLAQEAGGTLEAGVYTVTFRCIDGLFGTVFQIYQSTLTFAANGSGGFVVTASNAATPTPTGGATGTPTPTGTATTTASPTQSGSPTVTPTRSPTTSASPTASVTPGGSPSPTVRPSTSPTAAPTVTPFPTATPAPGSGSLAFTGAPVFLLVLTGLGLTTVGAGLLFRRRR